MAKPTSKKKNEKTLKILWCLDPFSELEQSRQRVIEFLREFAKKRKIEIEPVFVLGVYNFNWIGQMQKLMLEKMQPSTVEALEDIVQKSNLDSITNPKLILNFEASRKQDVKKLLSYAKRVQTDLIILNTHAREGIQRMFLGSFAESVLQSSKIPMIFVSPQTMPITKINRVMAPVDLSEAGERGLKVFRKQISGNSSSQESLSITFFHQLPYVGVPYAGLEAGLSAGAWSQLEEIYKQEGESRLKKMNVLSENWKKHGWQVRVEVNEVPQPPDREILKRLKKDSYDIVALTSEAGPFSSVFFGSVAKEIVRHASCPVWVYHLE